MAPQGQLVDWLNGMLRPRGAESLVPLLTASISGAIRSVCFVAWVSLL